MRNASSLAPLALAVLVGACGQKPTEPVKEGYVAKTGTAKVKPHDDVSRNDAYCRYKVTKLPDSGALLKVDDYICIYCPPGRSGCDNYSKIEELGGAVYEVSALDNGMACTNCPKSDASPNPGWTRELQ
jgi:hypothetical protein